VALVDKEKEEEQDEGYIANGNGGQPGRHAFGIRSQFNEGCGTTSVITIAEDLHIHINNCCLQLIRIKRNHHHHHHHINMGDLFGK